MSNIEVVVPKVLTPTESIAIAAMKVDPYGNRGEEGQNIIKTTIQGTTDEPISYKFPVNGSLSSSSFQLTGKLSPSPFDLGIPSSGPIKRLLARNTSATMKLQIPASSSVLVKITSPADVFTINGSSMKWPSESLPLHVKFSVSGEEIGSFCWPWEEKLQLGDFTMTQVSEEGDFVVNNHASEDVALNMTIGLANTVVFFESAGKYVGKVRQDVKVRIAAGQCAMYKKDLVRYSFQSDCDVIPGENFVQCLCTKPGFYTAKVLGHPSITHSLSDKVGEESSTYKSFYGILLMAIIFATCIIALLVDFLERNNLLEIQQMNHVEDT